MHEILLTRTAWVLSGSLMRWGDEVADSCDAIVFLMVDTDIRMQRLRALQELRNQGRVADAAADEAFFDWASRHEDPSFNGRNRARQEAWIADRSAPVLLLDSSSAPQELASAVLDWSPA